MIYKLNFSLPFLPLLENQKNRLHYRELRRISNETKTAAMLKIGHRAPPKPFPSVHLTLTRYSSSEPDFDGLVSSFKPIVDALVTKGVIQDDRPSNFKGGYPIYRWSKAPPKKGYVKIELWINY